MEKIQGIQNLLKYLESVDYPMTEDHIKESIAKRTIPHSQSYSNLVIFDLNHIDWWVAEQKKLDINT